MKFVAKVLLFPVVLLSAFLVLMLKWTLNLSAFVLCFGIVLRHLRDGCHPVLYQHESR